MKIIEPSYEILDRRNMDAAQKIEQCGRLAYKSEDKITEDSAIGFFRKMVESKHYPVIEFSNIHVCVKIDRPAPEECEYDNTQETVDDFLGVIFMNKYLHFSPILRDSVLVGFILSGTVRAFVDGLSFGEKGNSHIENLIVQELSNNKLVFPFNLPELKRYEGGGSISVEIISPATVKFLIPEFCENHLMCAVKFIINRAVSHELVRHRPLSILQESQRYCVAGNMLLSTKNQRVHLTINDLYNKTKEGKNNQWKRYSIRQLNTDTGEIQYSKISNVFFNGVKPTITLKTKLGYSIIVTKDHEIYTGNSWKKAELFKIGEHIIVNGSDVKTLLYGVPDEIVSIKDSGNIEVFDIEMKGEFPNFFANGVCVHNCNYNQDKFGKEVTFIAPRGAFDIFKNDEAFLAWQYTMEEAENNYLLLLQKGASPQAARTVLPNSCKTEIILYATIEEWKHIFKMRCSPAAEPSMRQVMIPLHEEFFSEENQLLWE